MKKYRKPVSKTIMLYGETLLDGSNPTPDVSPTGHIQGPQRAKAINEIYDDEE